MFSCIEFLPENNATLFFTPSHMADAYTDIIDRCICWDSGIDCAYGYMFDEIERKFLEA